MILSQAVLSERGKSVKIQPGLGFIWRIPANEHFLRLLRTCGGQRIAVEPKP
jgi:hypothetical protein